MGYDRDSFIAGITVGRNMESWPAVKGENVFQFTVEGSRNYSSPCMIFRGVIDWGDGSQTSVTGSLPEWDYTRRPTTQYRHTYATDGDYQITLRGVLLDWQANISVEIQEGRVKSIDTPLPRTMSGRSDFSALVAASPITSLPSKLFRNIEKVTSITNLCQNCRYLKTVPPDLLYNCQDVTDGANSTAVFAYSGLEYVPPELFAYCPNLTHIAFFFEDSKLKEIPDGLFDPLQKLTYTWRAFRSTKITGIPLHLFDNCTMIETLRDTFYGCDSIVGYLPPLWEQFPNTGHTGCFYGCVNAINYADVPYGWK